MGGNLLPNEVEQQKQQPGVYMKWDIGEEEKCFIIQSKYLGGLE